MSENKAGIAAFRRSNRILRVKFFRYLFPSMLTMAALSLSEFADSMIVSNLLGEAAMTVVQMGTPVMLIAAMAYTLIGGGGATRYALALGERDNDKAGRLYGVSMVAACLIGVLFLIFGLVLFHPLVKLLCSNLHVQDSFEPYLFALLFSLPFLVSILSFVCFLAPSGAPAMATVVNIVANVVNILMDVVYIKVLHLGVTGAAWATFTGYMVAVVFAFIALRIKKVDIRKKMPKRSDFSHLKDIFWTGSPTSLTQLGYAIKIAFCNTLAGKYGGQDGIVAFSLCIQSLSIMSIFLGAVMEASGPFLALLHGEGDHRGKGLVLKLALVSQFICSLICVTFFVTLPGVFADLYNVHNGMDLSVHALRIFTLSYLLRGFYMQFMKYLQVVGRKWYAIVISLIDGFIGVIILCEILCPILGIDGLWWSFTVLSVLLLLACLVTNLVIVRRSRGRYKGLLLEENDPEAPPLMDVTIHGNGEEITSLSEQLQNITVQNGVDKQTANRVALALEETAVYLENRREKNEYLDILARAFKDRIEIDFRCLGMVGSPDDPNERDVAENIHVLKSISDHIEFDYIMGMNCMRIEIDI